MEFQGFPKMPRLSREVIISEKLDGTNAQVLIQEFDSDYMAEGRVIFEKGDLALYAGSRTRWITPEDDNYGFARWCKERGEELLQLGPGRHFGEWWGQGIQRGYGLKEKRFSLFNVARWSDEVARPACCNVVPELYRGDFNTNIIELELDLLRTDGSKAAPGFMRPEGMVIFHTAAQIGFKKTLEKDDQPKSLSGL
jgi:hypothetical protein